jgi:signal transduction histidine kinase
MLDFPILRSPRRRSLVLLVVGVLVVPAILLSVLALSLLGRLETLGRRSWSDYGQYLAELSIEHAEHELWSEEQRLMVAIRANPPENLDAVPDLLTQLSANPAYQFVYCVLPDSTLIFTANATWQKRTEAAVLRSLGPAWGALGSDAEGPAPLHHLAGDDRGHPFQVTYFTLRSWQNELLGAVVLIWDLGHLKTVVLPGLFAAGPPGGKAIFRAGYLRDHIAVSVIDEEGQVLFESRAQPGADLIAAQPFRRFLPFWRVGISLEDREYKAWVRSIRTTHIALIAGMLFVILLGGVFLLRWIDREIEAADQRSRFVSSVSHELKTPIALIRLYAETLELGRVADPERAREFLQTISREAQRLTHLVNNVLDISRIDAGHRTYSLVETDLARVVGETLDAYRYHLDEQGIAVIRHLDPGPLVARLDPEAITRALLNLLDNAVKYSNGAREIEVSLRQQGRSALLAVRDHGLGIPAGEQERIFDLFYRGNDLIVQQVKGSGLGLTLVQHIVAAHGGRVHLRSRPGEGSTFTIEMPVAEGTSSPA